MRRARIIVSRLAAVFRGRRSEREIDDEIASHLEEAADEYIRQGLSPEEARWAARRSFGGVTQAKEVHRQLRTFAWAVDLPRELRFGARILIKHRWITLSAVVALAIGIAANNTVFAIVNAIQLRDLPFDQPDRIVAIGTRIGDMRTLNAGVSYADFQDWRSATRTFTGLGAMRETTMNVGDEGGAPERLIGSYVSSNAFALVGQRPLLGRDFSPDDDRPGATPVVILGHSLWRNRYGSNPAVLGRTIRVNGVSSVVIGIMPEAFGFATRSRLWQPVGLLPEKTLTSRDARDLSAFGRLVPGASIDQAVAELNGVAGALAQRYPETNRDVRPLVAPYHERSVGRRGRSTVPLLMGVVACVLLMACANVANLLLARAAVRSHEISVRMAMGASRAQIIRQLLIESLLLAALAGTAGWGLTLAAIRTISGAFGNLGGGIGLPYWITFTVDEGVFAFSIGISLATVLLVGLVPALQTSKVGFASTLVEGGRTAIGRVHSRRWVHGLVVVQLALSPALLTGGVLMMRSLVAQYEIDAGVNTEGIVWARLELPEATYPRAEDRLRFYRQLDERLAGAAGVVAGMASNTPLGGGAARNLWRDDEIVNREPRRPRVLMVAIGPRYFETLRTRVVRGSDLPLLESQGTAPLVLLNEALAAAVFPGEDPIGRRIRLTAPTRTAPEPEWFTIAGIAPNIRQTATDSSGRDGVVYVSYASNSSSQVSIIARSGADPSVAAATLRREVGSLDPDLPLFDVMTLNDWLDTSDGRVALRVFGTMFVAFAVVALLLATVGLYAVTAYAAAQRTREIGVRLALGAQASQIWWLVTRDAAWQLGVGLSIGMAGALGVGQVLASAFTGTRVDPATLFVVAGSFVGVGFAACLVPARRAMRLDPAVVLRSD